MQHLNGWKQVLEQPCVRAADAFCRYSFLFSILSQSTSATSPLSICQFMDVAVMSAGVCAVQCV